jgi:hypothetical protein
MMTPDFEIINAKNIIKAKPSGDIDLEQSKKVLIELASLSKPPASYNILIDVREVVGNLTLTDMYELIFELCKHRQVFSNKIALLVRDDRQILDASILELYAKDRGFNAKALTDFEETIEWFHASADPERDPTSYLKER